MGELSLLQWAALLVVILGLSSNRLIELFRNLGGRGPGGPQHPLPVSSPIERNATLAHSAFMRHAGEHYSSGRGSGARLARNAL